eukprot:79078_1
MEFVHQGNQLFVEENYQEAVDQYTNAICKLMGKEQFPALFGRGRANMYLDNHYNAIRDFGECISLDHQHQLTNYYLGLCLMKIGKKDVEKMQNAHKYLLIAQNGSSKQSRFEKAVSKAIKLLQKLQPKVEISTPQSPAQAPTNTDGDIEMKSNETQTADTKPTVAVVKPKIRESWYQSATNITFTFYAKKLTRDDVSIRFERQTVVVQLKLKDGTVFTRNMALKHEIKENECSFTMNPYKIILTLIKKTAGEWDGLESVMDDGKQPTIAAPWTTKRNWKEVDQYAAKELEAEKPEGDEALQSLFSKIYKDADEDQRRAMVKSFQTSGGTVLSTNWKDVKGKDYEGKDKVLPTGQDTAKWEF